MRIGFVCIRLEYNFPVNGFAIPLVLKQKIRVYRNASLTQLMSCKRWNITSKAKSPFHTVIVRFVNS